MRLGDIYYNIEEYGVGLFEDGQSFGRSDVSTLLQILVHQGEVERKQIGNYIYYKVQE